MMTFFSLMFVTLMLIMLKEASPLKMIVLLLLSSGSLFIYCFIKSGEIWAMTLLYLLIVGGIIISLMILSSIHLNQKLNYKPFSIKNVKFILILVCLYYSVFLPNYMNSSSQSMLIKWGFVDSSFCIFLTILLLIYFFSFLFMLNKSNFALRKNMCWYWGFL